MRHPMIPNAAPCSRLPAILATVIGLAGATQAVAEQVCRPGLAVTETRFSQPHPAASGRLWFALIAVDASGCAADSGGRFDLVVSRLKENAPELEFREQFVWLAPSVTIGVDFAADEAVERYRIDAVTPCRCHKQSDGAGRRGITPAG